MNKTVIWIIVIVVMIIIIIIIASSASKAETTGSDSGINTAGKGKGDNPPGATVSYWSQDKNKKMNKTVIWIIVIVVMIIIIIIIASSASKAETTGSDSGINTAGILDVLKEDTKCGKLCRGVCKSKRIGLPPFIWGPRAKCHRKCVTDCTKGLDVTKIKY